MQKNLKNGLIAGLAAALLALSITFVGAGTPAPTPAAGAASETVLQVSNLSCGACAKNIESELRKHPGMQAMSTDMATGRVTIKHTAELTPERLAELVTAVGYPAKVAATTGAAPDQAAAAGNPGCKNCELKGGGSKNCNVKNCNVKNCEAKNCDPKNCEVKNCDKNCAAKNCAAKNAAAPGCNKKGCRLPAPAPEKS